MGNTRRYIIDTNSLLIFVKYYYPFDTENQLTDFIHQCFNDEIIILLESVSKECSMVAKGIIIEELDFISKVKTKKSKELIDKKIHNKIDNNWNIRSIKSTIDFESVKNQYVKSADFQLILYGLNGNRNDSVFDITVVTEETKNLNDNKVFKKIPLICEYENIKCCNVQQMLDQLGVTLKFNVPQ